MTTRHAPSQLVFKNKTANLTLRHLPMHLDQKNRILLAEDNEFNQELVIDLLSEAGFSVTAANNGQEALQLLAQHAPDFFHVILMDLEMPVMDGYQATSTIRQQSIYHPIPIIALTAHEEPATKETCLASGMQDYLIKPFDLDELHACLQKWLNHTQREIAKKPNAATSGSYPQFQHIDTSLGLRSTANNHSLYLQLLQRFATAQRLNLKQIRSQHTTQLDQNFQRLIHTLKGIGATIGASKIATLCTEIEIAADKIADPHDVVLPSLFTALAFELENTLDELDAFLLIAPNAQTAEAKPNPDCMSTSKQDTSQAQKTRDILNTLKKLLQENDSAAVNLFEQQQSLLASTLENQRYIALQNAIENYDFELASRLLDAA
jgi:two-component system sensor histidine kinase/response regulator